MNALLIEDDPVIWTQEGNDFSTSSNSSIKNFPITQPAKTTLRDRRRFSGCPHPRRTS